MNKHQQEKDMMKVKQAAIEDLQKNNSNLKSEIERMKESLLSHKDTIKQLKSV
jgi:predicted RNase H-like nuclease (RuvC/YqgF family)